MLAGSALSEWKLRKPTRVDAAPPEISELSEYDDAIAQCACGYVTYRREGGESFICGYRFSCARR